MAKSKGGMCALVCSASLAFGCATPPQTAPLGVAPPAPAEIDDTPAPALPGATLPAWLTADRRPLPPPLVLNAARGPASSRVQRPVEPLAQRSLWNRLRAGLSLPESDSPRVQRELDWYVSHPDYL
ncbi:MAG: hypothetical protein OEN20_03770, partial [Gammaproteobacteria bacterium]|nr:hypothetical protein [Gammaproteobacteria bacterium]